MPLRVAALFVSPETVLFMPLRVAAILMPLRVAAVRNRSVLFMPLRVAALFVSPETVPTGFRHLPPGRRYALHP
jgi:hypothetical protein